MKLLSRVPFKEIEIGEVFAYLYNDGVEIYCKLNSEEAMFLADDWDKDWEGDYFVKPGDTLYCRRWMVEKLSKSTQSLWRGRLI